MLEKQENKMLEKDETVNTKTSKKGSKPAKKFMFPGDKSPVIIEAKDIKEATAKFTKLTEK